MTAPQKMLSRVKRALVGLFTEPIAPRVTPNTFFVWEPCTRSHAEVLPGYARYLLDLGFDVLVLVNPRHVEDGLLSRLQHPRLQVVRAPTQATLKYFKAHALSDARGILVTTARKLGDLDGYARDRRRFERRRPGQKVLLVEHDVQPVVDRGTLEPDIITLRQVDYRGATAHVVNPHHFGSVQVRPKGPGPVTFIAVGGMQQYRRNTNALVDAADALVRRGVQGFRVVVVGKGGLRGLPRHLQPHFEHRHRASFTQLYADLEAADFLLTLLDPDNPRHDRYITTGTSGSFQLVYGFAKPCLVPTKFAPIHRLDSSNSLLYERNADLAACMQQAIEMSPQDHARMQQALQRTASALHAESLQTLRRLIDEP